MINFQLLLKSYKIKTINIIENLPELADQILRSIINTLMTLNIPINNQGVPLALPG